MDYESLLLGMMNSRLTKQVAQSQAQVEREDRSLPNSSRRAFESRMKTDAAVARVAAQNMEDGKTMVNVAQTYTTSIKSQLQSIQKILTDIAETDNIGAAGIANASNDVQDRISEILRLANNATFNGMNLMDGTAGSNGTVQLQAGNSPRGQKFVNMLDGGITAAASMSSVNDRVSSVLGSTSLNLNNLGQALSFASQADAKDALEAIDAYIERVGAIEGQYSYDYKSLDNMSLLFEEQADIYEDVVTRSQSPTGTATSTSASNILSQLLSSSGSSILSGSA